MVTPSLDRIGSSHPHTAAHSSSKSRLLSRSHGAVATAFLCEGNDEAADAFEQALKRYEGKKNLAMVAQVKPKLEALRSGVS
jgi:hypothetical protein